MQGHIDAITDGCVLGWVKLNDESHSIIIDVFMNGQKIAARHPANLMRPDVRDAGIGHGRYGFSVAVPEQFRGLESVTVTVHACDWIHTPISEEVQLVSSTFQDDQDFLVDVNDTLPLEMSAVIHIDNCSESIVRGWSVDKSDPAKTFHLDISIDGVFFARIMNDRARADLKNKNISDGLGGFEASLPLQWLDSGEHIVAVRAPDGTTKEISVNCMDKQKLVNLALVAPPIQHLSIIIPVYNAADDLLVCIERLAAYTPKNVNILFIDDASPDVRISEILSNIGCYPNMRVLRNAKNLGFSQTVNRGLADAIDDDVIILNSDARVTPGWVEGMTMAARSAPRIATVTAMSDRAGAFSAPRIGNDNALPERVGEIAYARAFRRHSLGLYPVVPTGNGFCMFISRECITEIGTFDAEAFPRGYGEENDFCMRAVRAGWRNIIDDRTYVFHDRSKSFGESKLELMRAGREVVDTRYPEYKKAIGVFSSSAKINLARFRAQAALRSCEAQDDPKLRILFVVSTQTGGTPQTNRDLMRGLSGGVDGWILRCDSTLVELSRMEGGESRVVRTHRLEEVVEPIRHRSDEYDALISNWLIELDPDIVHIRHLGWHSLSLPQIIKNLGKKIVFSFHDYYTLCPTVKLLDEKRNFCGGTCTEGKGECQIELWPVTSLPELKDRWVHVWRQRFAEALAPCDAFITTSESARTRILEHMPSIPADRFKVIPHGRDFGEFRRLGQPPLHGDPLRILLPGNISHAKGLDFVYDLLEEDKAGLLEFHVLGAVAASNRGEHPRLVKHGAYQRDNFAEKVRPIRPHLGAIFSIWDETYCHTLTELWSIGLPAIVFDYATVAGRVRKTGAGWVMKHHDIPALYQQILTVGFDRRERIRVDTALLDWQEGEGAGNTTRLMASAYMGVYRDILRTPLLPHGRATKARIAVVCPTSKDLQRANPSTHLRIWERTRNRVERDVTYIPMSAISLLANVNAGTIDGAIIQGMAVPPTLSDELLNSLEKNRIPYLFDFDKKLLETSVDEAESGQNIALPSSVSAVVCGASLVSVPTDIFQREVTGLLKNVVVLPDQLSARLWATDLPVPSASFKTVTAVYMGSSTHDDELQMILPGLDAIADVNPDFRLVLIGVTEQEVAWAERRWLTRVEVPEGVRQYDKFVPWLREQTKDFDFAIAPLEETSVNRCNSGLKILDYAALGLPVVASDVASYRQIAAEAPAVRLVSNKLEDWRAALQEQVDLNEKNSELGNEMREWVLNNRLLDVTLSDFDDLVLSMILKNQMQKHKLSETIRRVTSGGSLRKRLEVS